LRSFKDEDLDAEVGVYLKSAGPAPEALHVRELPSATVASTVHRGAFNRIGGLAREIFLHIVAPVSRENESYVTKIQVPVVKE
jgi:effector-binding domain-containing protein